MTTGSQARDEFYEAVTNAWVAAEYDPCLLNYEDVPSKQKFPPAESCPWARLQFHHVAAKATTIGRPGNRRFERRGLASVQIMCPTGSSMQTPEEIARIVHNALEGVSTASDVAFLNVRTNEVGSDGHWYMINVLADFRYSEIR